LEFADTILTFAVLEQYLFTTVGQLDGALHFSYEETVLVAYIIICRLSFLTAAVTADNVESPEAAQHDPHVGQT